MVWRSIETRLTHSDLRFPFRPIQRRTLRSSARIICHQRHRRRCKSSPRELRFASSRAVHSRKQRRQGHRTSPFNIIVETRNPRFILFQQSLSVGQAEIFKVDECVGEQIRTVLNKLVHEFVVQFPPYSGSFPSEVQRVGELHVVVGSWVKNDGENSIGLDAGSQSVKSGFGERDGDSTDTLVCQVPQGVFSVMIFERVRLLTHLQSPTQLHYPSRQSNQSNSPNRFSKRGQSSPLVWPSHPRELRVEHACRLDWER